MGFFWGLIFGPGIFMGFVGSPRDFWVLIFAPIRSSPSLEIRSTPRAFGNVLLTLKLTKLSFSLSVEVECTTTDCVKTRLEYFCASGLL